MNEITERHSQPTKNRLLGKMSRGGLASTFSYQRAFLCPGSKKSTLFKT